MAQQSAHLLTRVHWLLPETPTLPVSKTCIETIPSFFSIRWRVWLRNRLVGISLLAGQFMDFFENKIREEIYACRATCPTHPVGQDGVLQSRMGNSWAEFPMSANYRSLTGKKWVGPKILNVSGQNDWLEIRPRPHGAETGENNPVSFYAEYSRRWFSTEKVDRINPARIQHARCIQTFSHKEIQTFKLSRNTFECVHLNCV